MIIFCRLLTVPSMQISAYLDLIASTSQSWEFWSGIDTPRGVAYFVGLLYLNDPNANSNTNAFVYQLAGSGALMYLAISIFVGFVFKLIDEFYAKDKSNIFMGIGFLYGVLLVEQRATTALLTSGVGLLVILFQSAVLHQREISGRAIKKYRELR